jgi:copper chaperone CopZ
VSTTTTKQVVRLGVDGMDCRACEQLLVEHVQRMEGVSASFADAEKGTLALLAEQDLSVDEVAGAIVSAGFIPVGLSGAAPAIRVIDLRPPTTATPVAPTNGTASPTPSTPAVATSPYRRLTLSAVGMHCVACEKLVTLTTRKVAGVVAAEGDTPTNTVTVYINGNGEVSLEALAQAIVAAGFTPGDPMVVTDTRVDALPDA